MGFVRMTHSDPAIGDFAAPEAAVEVWGESGWKVVNPDDVRQFPSDFEADLDPEIPDPPAKSASKAAWQSYATTVVGMPEDVVAHMSRDEIVTHLVPQED